MFTYSAPRYPNLEEDGSRSTFFLELTKEFNYSLAEKLALQLKVKSDKILSLKNKHKEDAPLFACHLLNAWYDNVTLDNTDICKQLAAALLKIGRPVEAKKVDPEIKGQSDATQMHCISWCYDHDDHMVDVMTMMTIMTIYAWCHDHDDHIWLVL